jgi:hypothetical protein
VKAIGTVKYKSIGEEKQQDELLFLLPNSRQTLILINFPDDKTSDVYFRLIDEVKAGYHNFIIIGKATDEYESSIKIILEAFEIIQEDF